MSTTPTPLADQKPVGAGKKYVVVAGNVLSQSDRQVHYISANRVMELYRVEPRECIVIEEDCYRNDQSPPPRGYTWQYLNSLILLRPMYSGDYSLPAK